MSLSSSILYQIGFGINKWKTLAHNGVYFPPEYEPHNIPLTYNDQKIPLSKWSEECAMLYVKYIGSEYDTIKFKKNFWNDWIKTFDTETKAKITDFNLCDFTQYKEIYLTKKIKSVCVDSINVDMYKIAYVDGIEQPVGNFRIEPPGLFLGRGNNNNLGKIKRRIYPEDVIINIGKNEIVPKPYAGKWKSVIHNKSVEWIASWDDYITGKKKYVLLGNESNFKSNSDLSKFELARKLKKKIKIIREINNQNLNSDNIKIMQLATALYLIDNLGIRVGNEKLDNGGADTVGTTTLRLEHIQIQNNMLTLDFLGKDSVRYINTIEIPDIIKQNISILSNNKNPYEQLFDKIQSKDINEYLQSFIKKLSAKMFRTFHASSIFQKELLKFSNKCDKNINVLDILNNANMKVAKMLNHQKNVGKSHKIQINKLSDKLMELKTKLKNAQQTTKPNNEKIMKIKTTIKTMKDKITTKNELKNLSLGTSRENYIDPRITIAFLKTHQIEFDKIFSQKQLKKFKWAIDVDETYKF